MAGCVEAAALREEPCSTAISVRHRHKRAQKARAGYESYVQHWSESAVVPQYLDLIRRTAEARGRTEVVNALAMESLV